MIFNKLYLPLIVFIIGLILIIKIKKNSEGNYILDVFSVFQIPIPISINLSFKSAYIKCAFILVMTFFLVNYYIGLDYSIFFPQNLKMIVKFNEQKGIDDLIKDFDLESIDDALITRDTTYINFFFSNVDTKILKYTNYKNFFYDCVITKENAMEITGYAEFRVKKTDGFQNYMIETAKGELINSKILKDEGIQSMSSEFNKITGTSDKISWNPLKPFNKIILTPQFNQIVSIKDNKGRTIKIPQENIYGVTKVYIFPKPCFSNTLYLVKHNKYLVPIGYAAYY